MIVVTTAPLLSLFRLLRTVVLTIVDTRVLVLPEARLVHNYSTATTINYESLVEGLTRGNGNALPLFNSLSGSFSVSVSANFLNKVRARRGVSLILLC